MTVKQNLKERLKAIVRDFHTENDKLSDEELYEFLLGVHTLETLCNTERTLRQNSEYWTHEGTTRYLSSGDDFTKDGGARVKPISFKYTR